MRSEFQLNDEVSVIQWKVYDIEQVVITYGIVNIPIEVHTNWGNDDSYIEDYVLNQLNLARL